MSTLLPTDVLFGVGRRVQNHPGNSEFRTLVSNAYKSDYVVLSTSQRREFHETFLDDFLKTGRRFVEETAIGETTIVTDRERQIDKIERHFRTCARSHKQNRYQESQPESPLAAALGKQRQWRLPSRKIGSSNRRPKQTTTCRACRSAQPRGAVEHLFIYG